MPTKALVPSVKHVERTSISGNQHLHILLVDDQPQVLRIYGKMMDRLGHVVTTAGDGKEAWRLLQQYNMHRKEDISKPNAIMCALQIT